MLKNDFQSLIATHFKNKYNIAKTLQIHADVINIYNVKDQLKLIHSVPISDMADHQQFVDLPQIQSLRVYQHKISGKYICRLVGTIQQLSTNWEQYKMYHISHNVIDSKDYRFWKQLNKNSIRIDKEPILEDSVKEKAIKNTLDFFKNKRQYKLFGLPPKRGIILSGEPGNGKSLLIKWVKSQLEKLGVNIYQVTTQDITKKWKEGTLIDFFKNSTNSLYVLDDVDIGLFDRSKQSNIACDLLSALDYHTTNKFRLILVSTNEKVSDIDPAFRRPGRIDEIIHINKPDRLLRGQYFDKLWAPYFNEIVLDREYFLNETEELSFADLDDIKRYVVENIINSNVYTDILQKSLCEWKDNRNKTLSHKGTGFHAKL